MTTKQGVEFDRIINAPVPGLRCTLNVAVPDTALIYPVYPGLSLGYPMSTYACLSSVYVPICVKRPLHRSLQFWPYSKEEEEEK